MNASDEPEKVKPKINDPPKCPLCGRPMDESDVGVDPGTSMWDCIGYADSCNVQVFIEPRDMSDFEDDDEEASDDR